MRITQKKQKPNSPFSGAGVTAILGPTNTGKTHLAIDRLVSHPSGMIGLPLRLLAREVYGRVCERVGTANVALITGEEKIAPPGARYSVCTVEALPRQTDVSFVAIDEVQLAGDLERGHVFADRILHLRGRDETLLLGAATMSGILSRLLPGLTINTRPRLSQLYYAGSKKITRLPRRTAIVAFSADQVYSVAELIRRQRGGAAVVLGALSPRTRNAQVALYQNGDVDYLVATDAIGMGLNLDVDHVAFAQSWKFDGFQHRALNPAELAQIAGRAGRYQNDGTFGVTGLQDAFDEEIVQRIERHEFAPVRTMQWRSRTFDFSSIKGLMASLDISPSVDGLTRALPATDAQALAFLAKDEEVRGLAQGRNRVSLLWDCCALPDYRRIAPAQHADIIGQLFNDLARNGHVDEDYMAGQVRRADRTDGDIDTLSARIAQIRTWTYVSHRMGWLRDPVHWQNETRRIEDRLSDALHERLTKRFVDRRTSVLMRRLRENAMLEAEIGSAGEVTVEGHTIGTLNGFRFSADRTAEGEEAKAIRSAAEKALADEFEKRAEHFSTAPNNDLAIGSDGVLRWVGDPVASLTSGEDVLTPRIVLLADEQLTGPMRDKVQTRAERYLRHLVDVQLKPLLDLKAGEGLDGMAKGLAYQLFEALGVIDRRKIANEVRGLDQDARAGLRKLGVRFGAYHIFVPALLKPAPAGLLTTLWQVANDARGEPGEGDVVAALMQGRTSFPLDPSWREEFYRLGGFRVLGQRAVRVDILERLADLIRPALSWKPADGSPPDGAVEGRAFFVTPAMMSILGATSDDMEEILKGLGYRGETKREADVMAERIKSAGDVVVPSPEVANEAPKPDPAAEAKAWMAKATSPSVADTDNAREEEAKHAGEVNETLSHAHAAAQVNLAHRKKQQKKPHDPHAVLGQIMGDVPGSGLAEADRHAEKKPISPAAVADMEGDRAQRDEEEHVGELNETLCSAHAAAHMSKHAKPVAQKSDPHAVMAATHGPGVTAGITSDELGEKAVSAPSETPDAEAEEKTITIWRQGRTERGPRGGGKNARNGGGGRGGPKRKGQPNGRPAGKEQHASKKGGGSEPKRYESRPQKVDPDSPFAKLQSLKDKFGD
ncbi:helicase-related protein [Notoacmeibacter sp. MSK16QG-6]|uniref:helicase-related protein n=1 Tax=Notoacmeibacter sp. MSK16QG-6 TaxID=2957982 RepID=UPI0020A0D5A7|nr:helicase-related protein [Notoacmeibacter sp. MSK16QG-6]MCP1200189.1 helicase [Notoacmeibacter sp. MSK16QG-6]